MQLNILEQTENPLFKRKEISGIVKAEKAPSREDTLKLLSEKFSVPVEAIKIKNILGKFGSNNFKLEANIYGSREEKDALEIKKKKETDLEKKATEKAQEAASEKPVEPQEEKKTEEDPSTEETQKEISEEVKQDA